MNIKDLPRIFFIALCLLVLNATSVTPVFAEPLPEDELTALEDYPNWVASNGCSDAGGGSTAVTGASGLPPDVVKAINKLKPDYMKAAEKTKVPWQILAAIHYREASNNPNLDVQAGNPLGTGGGQFAEYPRGYPKTIEESAEYAAEHLIGKVALGIVKKPVNVPNPDPEGLKDALYSYNGRAGGYADQAATLGFNKKTQPYEGSPYVMNGFDSKHKNMKLITQDNGPVDGIDTRLGAYTLYIKLGGATGGSGDGCSTTGSGTIEAAVQTAIKYSWPEYHAPNYFKMKPEYKAAITKAIGADEYVGGGPNPGIDCGGFVTRVMRDSGADPKYNAGEGPTLTQQAYMEAHPEKYQNLGNVNNTDKLQPGDIAINSGHTYMYVGKQPGFKGNAASASYSLNGTSWRTPMASPTYFGFTWYRLK